MGSKIPEDSASVSSSSWETDQLDCPVCYTCLLPPIFQCKNGHLICKECIKKLNVCPVCRASLPRDKIRSCQWVLKVVELEEHAKICIFRPVRMCEDFGFHECNEEVPLNGIISHLKSAHQVREVNIQNGHYIELLQTGIADSEMDRGATLWSPVILEYDDYPPLVLKTTLTLDSLSWTISAVHSYEQVDELTAKIKLLTDKDEKASVTWKGGISKIKTNNADRNSSFSVPVCTIRGLDHWKLLIMIYREGEQIKTEREVLNLTLEPRPAPTYMHNHLRPGKAHSGVNCDRCGERVKGFRFKCSVCPDVHLCQSCLSPDSYVPGSSSCSLGPSVTHCFRCFATSQQPY